MTSQDKFKPYYSKFGGRLVKSTSLVNFAEDDVRDYIENLKETIDRLETENMRLRHAHSMCTEDARNREFFTKLEDLIEAWRES